MTLNTIKFFGSIIASFFIVIQAKLSAISIMYENRDRMIIYK